MIALLAATLLVSAASDEALRKLEKEVVETKTKQAADLQTIEKLLRARSPIKCIKKECEACTLPELSRLRAEVDEVHYIDGNVVGAGTVWREYPGPEQMISEFIFDHPLEIERTDAESSNHKLLIVSTACFMLGVAFGYYAVQK